MSNRASKSLPIAAHLPKEGFVRLPVILALYPVGRSTWWAGVKAGRFPAPVKLGPRVTAWPVDAIRELIESMRAGDADVDAATRLTSVDQDERRRTP
jgi:prophage regulatory protein